MSQKLEHYLKKKLKGLDLKDVVDIILFGSVIKGKEFPKDVDICVIFRKDIKQDFNKKILSKFKKINAHISSLTIDNFFRKPHSLIKTILIEGKSILSGRKFVHNFGFTSASLYSYDLSKFKASDKVRFVYLLKGRKGSMGIIKNYGGEWVTDSCFIFPIENDNEILSIFKKWKVNYKKKEVLIQ